VPRCLSVLAAVTVLSGVVVMGPGRASADLGRNPNASASANPDKAEINVTASEQTVATGAAGSASSKPRCSFAAADFAGTPGVAVDAGVLRRDATDKVTRTDLPAGENTETLYQRMCGENVDWVWVSDARVADVAALLASARQSVTAQIPAPATNMNPDPSVGGIVNIGLWLAVRDPGQVSITASVGPAWATVTARYDSTRWNFGNGDSVACPGVGTPIVDWNVQEQGPCGYTYRWPSAPKFTGTQDLRYHASVTGHWVVTYATSKGDGGSLPAIDRTTPFLYKVREIQTVRVAPGG
jgi:hypothetical protein